MASQSPARHGADPILMLVIVALCLFGLMMIASASAVVADRFRDDVYFFVKHQLFYGGLFGIPAFLIGFFTPYRSWRKLALPAIGLSLVLLILVFVPGIRLTYGGASRWIALGPLTLQPTEITKLAFIVYLAALIETKGADMHNFRKGIAPFLVIMGIIGSLIILQPDMGTLITIFFIAAAMIFAGGIRWRHLMLLLLGSAATIGILINTATYRVNRIITYLHPELDPRGVGYQINQALLAAGTGGWWGLGLGRSRQKYQYLPEPASDSIFAIIAEELGFIRTSLVLLAFAVLAWRGFKIARSAPDLFGRLVGVGVTSWIVSQAFVNMGAALGVTPLTGIPLPFISYGSSALVSMLFASGILLNISKYTRE